MKIQEYTDEQNKAWNNAIEALKYSHAALREIEDARKTLKDAEKALEDVIKVGNNADENVTKAFKAWETVECKC